MGESGEKPNQIGICGLICISLGVHEVQTSLTNTVVKDGSPLNLKSMISECSVI